MKSSRVPASPRRTKLCRIAEFGYKLPRKGTHQNKFPHKWLSILNKFATQKVKRFAQEGESVPITSAVGRISRDAYYNPTTIPAFNSTAMDGYAVNSASNFGASPTRPIVFLVRSMCTQTCSENVFDACIKDEDTIIVPGPDPESRYIQITGPIQWDQNRRIAGSDFQPEDLIVSPGTTIKPSHVMALAAVGIQEVKVYRKLRIGIVSTGEEVVSIDDKSQCGPNQIRHSDGPLGVVDDDPKAFDIAMTIAMERTEFDVIVTAGAVSMGRFDFVSQGLVPMKAQILFHKVAMRPEHPALFTKLRTRHKVSADDATITPPASPVENGLDKTEFFGLPGNPVAAVTCVRFLVDPYLRALHGLPVQEKPKGIMAVLNSNVGISQDGNLERPKLQQDKAVVGYKLPVAIEPGIAFVGARGKVEVHDMY
ncbi:uncharacterized protein PAC_12110 [Phialocephala subalpina]|uniref:molybdopterin adenylyltransferase n=1 Tax=Phialocephala subalpina TaxID=576137 RepID=A0A1L7XB10_9HELO|nr:uncharacterized protein PAC_12110 [Phialocephala subalpina]